MSNGVAVPKQLNIELQHDPAITFMDIYPKVKWDSNKYLYTYVHSRIVFIVAQR